MGAWIYASVRPNAGVTSGGMWVWDDSAVHPIDSPFYEYFAHLKPSAERGPQVVALPTGMRIEVRQPLMACDISYADRARMDARLRFEALEPPNAGEPPYPKAHHFDQTGRVTGRVTLDGEPIVVDCFAMRDRSWGPRPERGYRRVAYTWAAGVRTSLLTYTAPAGESAEHIYSGYLCRDNRISRIINGRRQVERHPVQGWVSAITVDAETDDGDRVRGRAEAGSRLLLAMGNHVCACTLLAWDLGAESLAGEDQDVWPIPQWGLTSRRWQASGADVADGAREARVIQLSSAVNRVAAELYSKLSERLSRNEGAAMINASANRRRAQSISVVSALPPRDPHAALMIATLSS